MLNLSLLFWKSYVKVMESSDINPMSVIKKDFFKLAVSNPLFVGVGDQVFCDVICNAASRCESVWTPSTASTRTSTRTSTTAMRTATARAERNRHKTNRSTLLHYFINNKFQQLHLYFILYQYCHFYDFLPQPCEPHLSNNEAGLGNPPGHSAKVSGQHSGTQCGKIAMCLRKWTHRKQIWSIETYYAAPNG